MNEIRDYNMWQGKSLPKLASDLHDSLPQTELFPLTPRQPNAKPEFTLYIPPQRLLDAVTGKGPMFDLCDFGTYLDDGTFAHTGGGGRQSYLLIMLHVLVQIATYCSRPYLTVTGNTLGALIGLKVNSACQLLRIAEEAGVISFVGEIENPNHRNNPNRRLIVKYVDVEATLGFLHKMRHLTKNYHMNFDDYSFTKEELHTFFLNMKEAYAEKNSRFWERRCAQLAASTAAGEATPPDKLSKEDDAYVNEPTNNVARTIRVLRFKQGGGSVGMAITSMDKALSKGKKRAQKQNKAFRLSKDYAEILDKLEEIKAALPKANFSYLREGKLRLYSDICKTPNEKHDATARATALRELLGDEDFKAGGNDVNGSVMRVELLIKQGLTIPYDIDIYRIIADMSGVLSNIPEWNSDQRAIVKAESFILLMREYNLKWRYKEHMRIEESLLKEAYPNPYPKLNMHNKSHQRYQSDLRIERLFGMSFSTFLHKLRAGMHTLFGKEKFSRADVFIHESNIHIEILHRLLKRGTLSTNVFDCFYFGANRMSTEEFFELYEECANWYKNWYDNMTMQKEQRRLEWHEKRKNSSGKSAQKKQQREERLARLKSGKATKADLTWQKSMATRARNNAIREEQRAEVERELFEARLAKDKSLRSKLVPYIHNVAGAFTQLFKHKRWLSDPLRLELYKKKCKYAGLAGLETYEI